MGETIITMLAAASGGLAVACLVLFLGGVFSRLELERPEQGEAVRTLPLFFRLTRPLLALVHPFSRGSAFQTWRDFEAPRLFMGGYGEVMTPEEFVGYKLVFLLLGVLALFLGAVANYFILWLVLAVALGFYPSFWLSAVIRKRQLAIVKALPNVLDLLTLSVESGKDLLSSLRDILARRRMDPLGEELTRMFQEVQLGRKRSEALLAMANRVRQSDLTATVNAIVQAEELGVSIAQLLRIQGDMQRNKRFTRAEKLANEAGVKIIVPIVLFILPAGFIILLVPLAIYASRMFGG